MTAVAEEPCPICGAVMVARINSEDGTEFWGCSRFPSCQGTRAIDAKKGDQGPRPSTSAAHPLARPDPKAIRRNAYYRLLGVALMVVAGALMAGASVRDRVRGSRQPPAI
jgi:ssDNA-binding Zn-finger/Zn-ribbon topoisomerase 1